VGIRFALFNTCKTTVAEFSVIEFGLCSQGQFFFADFRGLAQQAVFLQGANSLRADLELDLAAINNKRFLLQVWLPHFLGVTL
jgi:hypothetical protein